MQDKDLDARLYMHTPEDCTGFVRSLTCERSDKQGIALGIFMYKRSGSYVTINLENAQAKELRDFLTSLLAEGEDNG